MKTMTASQQKTVERMKAEGWSYAGTDSIRMNNRFYTTVKMAKGDETISINSQGGFKGLATAKK